MKFDKEKMRNRVRENYKTKDSKSFLEYQKIFNISKDIKPFKPRTDKINEIIILPYEVKTDFDPKVKKGELTYILEYFLHRNMGINKESLLCMRRTFGKPCAVCESIDILREEYEKNKEIITQIKPTKRGIYNIVDCLNTENPNEIQFFDSSFSFFEEEMLEEVIDPETKETVCFCDPSSEGYTIRFRATEETYGTRKYFKYKSFRFVKRNKEIVQSVLDKAISFDEFLIIPTYEEIKNIFLGEESSESTTKSKDQIEEEIKTEKKSCNLEKPKEEKSNNKCPSGLTFHKDCDSADECIDCKVWEDCNNAEK